jgi:hypothetical protein
MKCKKNEKRALNRFLWSVGGITDEIYGRKTVECNDNRTRDMEAYTQNYWLLDFVHHPVF